MSNTSHQPVALVTGSGRPRVGSMVARYLADRQYRIALHYHASEEEALASRDRLRNFGTDCEAYQADVTSEKQVEEMVKAVHERFGRIDVLVTTSSIWNTIPLEELSAEDLRRSFDVNTLGTFLAARAAGRIMVAQPEGGVIVTIGDWAIKRPYLDHAAYFVAKGSIPTLTRVLARELGHRNPHVRVNCIHPGPVMFPPGISEDEKEVLINATLVKNADCPEAVAQTVAYFIENKFVTGACLPVDGGRHMYSPEPSSSGKSCHL